MIAGVKPYPKYKDSGLPWLGEVPEHWDVRRGKALFRCIDVRSSTGDEELLTVSSERGVIPRRSATVTMFKAESYVGYKLCWPGDLVINSLWAWGRGLGVSQYHGIVSSAYGVYRLRSEFQGAAGFIDVLVRSAAFNWELQVRSKGIWISRLQLTDESFLGAPFPVPPLDEQVSIVRFLEHADRRIRRYIATKQKLITLLKEQKQVIIHHAVTRGLDPYVRLKPSGVEWLAGVPEHWEVMPLNAASASIQTGPFGSQLHASEYVGGGTPVINPSHLRDGVIHPDVQTSVSPQRATDLARHQLKFGDVVMARRGELGRCAQVTREQEGWLCGTGSLRVRPLLDAYEPSYLVELLGSPGVREALIGSSVGATMDNLNASIVARLRLPVPPLLEQGVIMERVSAVLADTRSAVGQIQRELGLIREYRTRLIADVVTGKLDVREAAALLSDQVEEAEPLGAADVLAPSDEFEDEGDFDPVVDEVVA